MTERSDFETVRDALNYSHDPDEDRPYLAFLALDAIEAEVARLREERDALQRRFDERLRTRPKVSRRDLATRNRTLLAEVERLRAELNRFRKHFGLETDWEFE